MPLKWVNTSNLTTFECCFLIPQSGENYNAISSFTVLRQVPLNTFICSAVQYFHQFVIYCLLSCVMVSIYCSDVADNEHSYLLEIPVERSIFECYIKKRFKIILIKKYHFIFKNRNMQLRFEIVMTDIRDQLMTNDQFTELS